VTLLLDSEADVNLANKVSHSQPDCVEYCIVCYNYLLIVWTVLSFLMNQNGISALIASAAKNHTSVVSLLLSAGADVNHGDNVSHLLLYYALSGR
jgi:Ankyrin repeat